jgi:hypothetical protein
MMCMVIALLAVLETAVLTCLGLPCSSSVQHQVHLRVASVDLRATLWIPK